MHCEIKFDLPDWMIDVPFDEYCNIVNSCKAHASNAFYTKLDQIHEKRKARIAADKAGQIDIYYYV